MIHITFTHNQSIQDLSPHSLNIFSGRESELEYTAGNLVYGMHFSKVINYCIFTIHFLTTQDLQIC